MHKLSLLATGLLLAGCAVGPDYREPATPQAAFVGADATHYRAAAAEERWWAQFQDPTLDQLVDQGLGANLDLRVAAARVAEARALFGERHLDLAPHVGAAGAYARSDAPAIGSDDQSSASLGFDARWEIDLFGRVRRSLEAARAQAEGAEYQRRDVAVSVAAEIARNYFELRGAQQQLAVAGANLGNQREALRLTQARYEAGSGTELDVASARARVAATASAVPQLQTAEQRSANRLAVLLGRAPGQLGVDLSPRPLSPLVRELAVGTPGDLLRRRPDVRAAERALAASTAQVGIATADLFPRLSLTGFVGLVAGSPAGLGQSLSKAWSVSPTLSWPAFDFGSVRSRLRAAQARSDAALAVYEQAVLHALEDASNAFIGYAQQQTRLASLVEQESASSRAAALARVQYREGAIDFLRLLDAESTLLQSQNAVAQAQAELQVSVVAVYKALGGGWDGGAATVAAAR